MIADFAAEVRQRAEVVLSHLRTEIGYRSACDVSPEHRHAMECLWRERLVKAVTEALSADDPRNNFNQETGS